MPGVLATTAFNGVSAKFAMLAQMINDLSEFTTQKVNPDTILRAITCSYEETRPLMIQHNSIGGGMGELRQS